MAPAEGPLHSNGEDSVDITQMEQSNNPHECKDSQLGQITQTFTAAFLLHLEKTMLLNAERTRLIDECKETLESGAVVPGFRPKNGLPGKQVVNARLRSLQLLDLQRRVRGEVEAQQEGLRAMQAKEYRSFQKSCYSIISTTVQRKYEANRAAVCPIDNIFKSMRVRRDAADRWMAAKDARKERLRLITQQHERMLKEYVAAGQNRETMRRLELIKGGDMDAYAKLAKQEAERAKQGGASGASSNEEKWTAITKFLNTTEKYLEKLANKVANIRAQKDAENAAVLAATQARAAGLSEEEVSRRATEAAVQAAEKANNMMAGNSMMRSRERFYALAHNVEEAIAKQPTFLRPPPGASLRDYQLTGLQWMISLYNNHLNGILADEMGLGKTVQVMALIAYLMENKQNYGPHLIIVPNAVLINWKSELQAWLPTVQCVYYVGNRDERNRIFNQEVKNLQFNVLVTTYEFINNDTKPPKLNKIPWKYIIIDEAQRMKDRESKLARVLDKYKTSRRLLLTGTPLQNDLKELWSLLNLLLPEVFDDKTMFADWFGILSQDIDAENEDVVDLERRILVVNRLHQILEPFMLRRQVEDVERKLPAKEAFVIKVPMSTIQSTIYKWVKETGTLRLAPDDPKRGKAEREEDKRKFAPLHNRCMELRKICNHPVLSYPGLEYEIMDEREMLAMSGKTFVLDRMLVKLFLSGHRVLLFSTMTKLLDQVERYLNWRRVGPDQVRMQYRRIDGATSLEDREIAIKDFNRAGSEVFIFLLSIKAAGRGLNLQTSDTVIIYDPDANPKNEEQAIARSHRIGQTRPVRVFHFESVGEALPAVKEEDLTEKERAEAENPDRQPTSYVGQPRDLKYADSIESIVRNTIQKTKQDMAAEVIDAGRFNLHTTDDERKMTLEALLKDEDRNAVARNDIMSLRELNRCLARGAPEFELFERWDTELDWPVQQLQSRPQDVPSYMRYSSLELENAKRLTEKVQRRDRITAHEEQQKFGLDTSKGSFKLKLKLGNVAKIMKLATNEEEVKKAQALLEQERAAPVADAAPLTVAQAQKQEEKKQVAKLILKLSNKPKPAATMPPPAGAAGLPPPPPPPPMGMMAPGLPPLMGPPPTGLLTQVPLPPAVPSAPPAAVVALTTTGPLTAATETSRPDEAMEVDGARGAAAAAGAAGPGPGSVLGPSLSAVDPEVTAAAAGAGRAEAPSQAMEVDGEEGEDEDEEDVPDLGEYIGEEDEDDEFKEHEEGGEEDEEGGGEEDEDEDEEVPLVDLAVEAAAPEFAAGHVLDAGPSAVGTGVLDVFALPSLGTPGDIFVPPPGTAVDPSSLPALPGVSWNGGDLSGHPLEGPGGVKRPREGSLS